MNLLKHVHVLFLSLWIAGWKLLIRLAQGRVIIGHVKSVVYLTAKICLPTGLFSGRIASVAEGITVLLLGI